MGIRARRAIAIKVVLAVVAVAALGTILQLSTPQRVVERHVNAMRVLYDELQQTPNLDETNPLQMEWNERRDKLVRLKYLDQVEYIVPLAGLEAAQAKLYAALDKQKATNWISDWNYRPGSGRGIVITVADESWRQAYWKDVIDAHWMPIEE